MFSKGGTNATPNINKTHSTPAPSSTQYTPSRSKHPKKALSSLWQAFLKNTAGRSKPPPPRFAKMLSASYGPPPFLSKTGRIQKKTGTSLPIFPRPHHACEQACLSIYCAGCSCPPVPAPCSPAGPSARNITRRPISGCSSCSNCRASSCLPSFTS